MSRDPNRGADGLDIGRTAPATLTASGPDTTGPDSQVTVSFSLTNTGSEDSSYILDVGLPADWTVVSQSDAGGTWNADETKWLWQTITPDETVTPSVTLGVPQSEETGDYTVTGQAKDADGLQAETTHTVTVATATVTASGPDTTEPDSDLSISFSLTNIDVDDNSYILDLGLPTDWTVVTQSDAGGTWNGDETKWLWQTITPDETVTPSVTLGVPQSEETGDYTVTGQAKDADGLQDETTHPVTVQQSVTQAWTFDVGGRCQYLTPAVDTARVYVGGLQQSVYGLDRTTGSVEWQFDRAGALSDSSPVLADGTLFVGSGAGTMYGLAATDGTTEWMTTISSAIVSSPAVDTDTVYVGANDGTVRAFAQADGQIQWTHDAGSPVFSTVAIANGTVYVTTDEGTVHALDAGDGTPLWTTDVGTDLGHGSPTVANDTVYVAGQQVYALDNANGSARWTTSYGGPAGSTPTAVNGSVYVGSDDGQVYSITASDGTVEWTAATDGTVGSTPAVTDGTVLVGSTDGHLYQFDAASGIELTRVSLGAPVRSSPAIDNGEAYIGSRAGTIVALTDL